jgi:hypothetical protein
MGFLQRTTGDALDMTKVVISIWFKIPSAMLAAAQAKYPTVANHMDRWRGVIPLYTWGAQTTGTETEVGSVLLGTEPGIGDIFGEEITGTVGFDQGPGYIGIRCDPEGDAVIDAYIPLGTPASCTAVRAIATGYIRDPTPGSNEYEYTYTDISTTEEGYDDWFGGTSNTAVEAETVCHLLISWDLTNGSASTGVIGGADPDDAVSEASQMWMAFNDVNKTAAGLPMIWPGGDFDGNSHVSRQTYQYAGLDENAIGLPDVVATVGTIPSAPFSIPGPPTINLIAGADSPVLNIFQADIQVFTGVTLDASVEANRRLFITEEGGRASPTLAADHFGKTAEVRFRSVSDWQNGINRGTAGDFTPTGTITGIDWFVED